MNHIPGNRGIVNLHGTTNVTGSAVGDGARVYAGVADPGTSDSHERSRTAWHFGIVTILAKEAKAVFDTLALTEDQTNRAGARFHTGSLDIPGGPANVVATRAMGQGQRSVMAALGNLRDHYDPAVLVLVGIGGAIHDDLAVNDVVVATRVVYYDLRKVLRGKVLRRGEEREAPAAMVHAVNSFFTAYGDPTELRYPGGASFRVFHGPIGSGEAVIADRQHEIRKYLTAFNDKILAVDMEAGGLSQFCHEISAKSGAQSGWVVVRGVSDRADEDKDDQQHDSAAVNAAQTLRLLLPLLLPRG